MKTIRVLKETLFSTIPLAVVIIVVCGFIAPMESAFDYVKKEKMGMQTPVRSVCFTMPIDTLIGINIKEHAADYSSGF